MKYLVVYEYPSGIEGEPTNFGAYAPDLPGVGVTGDTLEKTRQLIHEAIDFHLEGLREYGLPIPQPAQSEYHEVAA